MPRSEFAPRPGPIPQPRADHASPNPFTKALPPDQPVAKRERLMATNFREFRHNHRQDNWHMRTDFDWRGRDTYGRGGDGE